MYIYYNIEETENGSKSIYIFIVCQKCGKPVITDKHPYEEKKTIINYAEDILRDNDISYCSRCANNLSNDQFQIYPIKGDDPLWATISK